MSEKQPIALLGAYGYTGALVAAELERRGASFVLAGRDITRLESLRARLPSGPEIQAVDIRDEHSLRRLAESCRVILTCAGPFTSLGPPVQDAALAAGCHFLDVTGELQYMRQSYAQRDARARERGVAIVNAVGFDVISTDLPAALAAEGLGTLARIDLAIAHKGSLSRGTLRSMMRILRDAPLGFEDGRYVEVPLASQARHVEFPAPFEKSWVVAAPLADIATAHRTTGARTVRTWIQVPGKLVRPAFHFAKGLRLARAGWLQASLERLIAMAEEGPDEASRAASRFATWAQATAADGRQQIVTLAGSSPYDFTAVVAAEAALQASSPDFEARGVLSPCQAFAPGALLTVLEAHGFVLVRHGCA